MKTKILNSINSLRGLLVVVLIAGIALPAFSVNDKKFYYSAGAKSTETAKGKVYVGTSAATGSSTYQNEMTTYTSKIESALMGSAPTKTSGISFYYSAKANDGYVFLGWKTTNSESAAYDYETESFTWNREVSNTTEIKANPAFNDAKVKYYAFFGSGIINLSDELIAFDKTQTGSFTVNYTANGTINITPTNSDFSVNPTSITATGSGSQIVTVSYNGTAEGTANTKINVTSTGLETKSLDAVAVPGTITSANASSVVIETGTVNTSTSHPYHPMENIDLTPCFAGTTASFNTLYLFGKTLNKTDFTATSLDIKTATTPCYVYQKSGNSYVFSKVVEMNSDIKGIGINVAANNSKLFFSGWCPYASCGYKSEDIGVFHITGGNDARVDVYLNNAWIYARTKFNGHLTSDFYAETSSGSYPTGSGGVFVFQTSANTSSKPFNAKVHVNGESLLSSQQGNQIKVTILGNVRYAAQCSSPIHMYTTDWSSQYEELTIDDIWPSSGGDVRTNGALHLMKSTNQAPSIDLGNQRSIVNFNGGRITLQNAIPVSDKYQTAFSISCRSYSQSGATVYGLGNDQANGTVNFNDGTIDVLPLSESDYTKYSSYYRDNKSIKCPSNVFINGGSYNCSIWKCEEASDLGASPTDKSGTSVCKLSIAQTGTESNGMAQYAIPSVFKAGLDAYYAEKGWTYGLQSIAADGEGNVNLMLPCDKIDESAIVNTEVIPWVGILPDFSAGVSGYTVDFGGDQSILSDETHSTERFLYGRMDDNVYNEISIYKTPAEAASVTLKSNDYNKNALNAEPYTIASNSYILLPIVADQWFFFTAPFDVKKVSIFDAYPDELVAGQTVAQALQKQAESNMDLFYYVGHGLQAGSQLDIEGLISQWVNCEKTIRYPDESSTIKNQFKKRELLPYPSQETAPSKSYFWLYENENEWTYDGKNFSGPTLVTAKTDNLWMQKGKVYSMMFPSEGIATGDWKYWTGKYILIEGGENCEIAGTNSHPATNQSYTDATKAAIKGNMTFADIAAPASAGAFWGYDYSSGIYKHQPSKTNPTQAFIYTAATPNDGTPAALNAIAASGRCYYSISYNSVSTTVIAAEEYATYSPENNAGIKYFYSNNTWKKLTYNEASNPLYLCDDSHYYGYNETSQKWELAEYTITYKDKDNDAFSGTHGSGYPTTHTYGTVTTLVDPTKEGYTFEGWFDNPACTGDKLTSLGATAYTADITLYAKWTEKSYAVTFNNGGHGTVQVAGTEVADGATALANHFTPKTLAATASTGYTFAGWTTTGSVTLGSTSDAFTNINATVAGGAVTATWTAISYTVRFNANGGTGSMSNESFQYDEPKALTLNTFTRTGYTFAGWATSTTGEVVHTDGKTVSNLSATNGATVDLYAKWTLVSSVTLEVKKDEQITINSNESVTTTIVHADGKLNIEYGKTLTTTELILEASESTSGEIIRGKNASGEFAGGIDVPSNAYFDLTHTGGFKARTWYAVAVPWEVLVPAYQVNGVYLKIGDEYVQQRLGETYDLIFYDGERRAAGENKAWTYVEDYYADPSHVDEQYPVMKPGVAYMIYLTSDADVIRFQKRTYAPVHTDDLQVTEHYSLIKADKHWNGIANPATYHARIDLSGAGVKYGQVYSDPINQQYSVFNLSDQLVVGQPVFVQVPSTSSVEVSAPSLARRRAKEQVSLTCYELMLAASDADVTDRVIVRMDENKTENEYVIGQDLVKMGVSNKAPQMWIDRYGEKMCVNTVAGFDNTADYPLGIFAPKNGEYDLFIDDQPNDETMLYLTYDGEAIWNLSYGGYVASLEKGSNTHYGLRIVKKAPQITTGIEETTVQNGEAVRKVLVNDRVYIIRNGEIYSVTGQKAK